MIIGGETKQFQVLIDPAKLRDYGLTLQEVMHAVAGSNVNSSGGFLERPTEEYLIRARGRVNSLEDLANSAITVRNGTPILVKNVATVQLGPALKRGDGSFNMHSDVVATIQKQPNANTIEVTRQIEAAIAGLRGTLPVDVTVDTKAFQQATFIERAIDNVQKGPARRRPPGCRCALPLSMEFPNNSNQSDGHPALSHYGDYRDELFRYWHQYDDTRWSGYCYWGTWLMTPLSMWRTFSGV